jgi:hypothetical protein
MFIRVLQRKADIGHEILFLFISHPILFLMQEDTDPMHYTLITQLVIVANQVD